MTTKKEEAFEINEKVHYLHRGSSKSRSFLVPAVILEIHPKSYRILIEGQLVKRYVDKNLDKIKKIE